MRQFLNDGLANRCLNHSANFPDLVGPVGVEPTLNGL